MKSEERLSIKKAQKELHSVWRSVDGQLDYGRDFKRNRSIRVKNDDCVKSHLEDWLLNKFYFVHITLCLYVFHICTFSLPLFFDLFDKMRYLIKKFGEWMKFTCGSVAQHV
jgi:hypothetical protein